MFSTLDVPVTPILDILYCQYWDREECDKENNQKIIVNEPSDNYENTSKTRTFTLIITT